tara:strand:+ start:9013 stop:9834 length:822 start_codon:yes stop_codon:yes gene_type:complete
MKSVELISKEHNHKIGQRCKDIEPNVTQDSLFVENGEIIGFYKTNITGKIKKLLDIIDIEFRSKNVPKSLLERSDVFDAVYNKGKTRKQAKATQTIQMSTILGSMLPKPHMRRPYPCVSSVHYKNEAKNFIKAMIMASIESESLIKKYANNILQRQKELVSKKVPKKWQFGNIFTGSISNYNISAPYHKDNNNLVGGVNVIYTTRSDAEGGFLNVPEYDITIEMAHNSVCVYPAWKNMHGVTPIKTYGSRSYRNTHIFYVLKGFEKYGETKEI